MAFTDGIGSNSYLFIHYLLSNPGKIFNNTQIAEGIRVVRTSLSFSASRIKDFILNSGKCDGVFKIIQRGKNRFFYKCIAENIDNVETWTLKYHKLYKEFNANYDRIRQGREKSNKLPAQTTRTDIVAPDFSNMTQPVNTGGKPIDVPIRISISVSVNFKKGE